MNGNNLSRLLASTLGKAPNNELIEDCGREDCPPDIIGMSSRLTVSRGAARIVTVALTRSGVTPDCLLSKTTLLSAVRTFLPVSCETELFPGL